MKSAMTGLLSRWSIVVTSLGVRVPAWDDSRRGPSKLCQLRLLSSPDDATDSSLEPHQELRQTFAEWKDIPQGLPPFKTLEHLWAPLEQEGPFVLEKSKCPVGFKRPLGTWFFRGSKSCSHVRPNPNNPRDTPLPLAILINKASTTTTSTTFTNLDVHVQRKPNWQPTGNK